MDREPERSEQIARERAAFERFVIARTERIARRFERGDHNNLRNPQIWADVLADADENPSLR